MSKTEVLNNELATVRVNVDDIEEAAQEVVQVVRNNPVVLAAVAVVAGAAGLAIGWKVAKNHLTIEFEERLEVELAEAKEFYKRSNKAEEYETPEKAAEALLAEDAVAALREYRGQSMVQPEVESSEVDGTIRVTNNVFVQADSDWDYDLEIKNRQEGVPYVISQEEFLENEPGHNQTTITYYEGDDILSDEQDKVIDDQDRIVGVGNLGRFGEGSGDKNVVYVRNEDLELDFMILHSRDTYMSAVHGYIEHSEGHAPRRFRKDRDD